jgi:hypothetical protein
MDGSLLVADQDVLELVLFEQLVVDIQHRAAGIAENEFDLFFLEAPDYNFCAGQLHGYFRKQRALPENA